MRKIVCIALVLAISICYAQTALAWSVSYDKTTTWLKDPVLSTETGDISYPAPDGYRSTCIRRLTFGTIGENVYAVKISLSFWAPVMYRQKIACLVYIGGQWYWPDAYAIDGGYYLHILSLFLCSTRAQTTLTIVLFDSITRPRPIRWP